MTSKAEQVVQALRAYGPSTCEDLAGITGISSTDISNMLREYRRNKKYGLIELGQATGGRGSPRKIVAVDEALYAAYMDARKKRHVAQVKRLEQAKRELGWQCARLPNTPFKTHWQPASPYHQGAA